MKPILTSLILPTEISFRVVSFRKSPICERSSLDSSWVAAACGNKPAVSSRIHIDSVNTEGNDLILFANINCSYIPFRTDNVTKIYQGIKALLPPELAKRKLQIRTDHHAIEELIPLALRNTRGRKIPTFSYKADIPLITRLSVPYTPTNGLQNRHIALWQSHGFYYESKLARWEWQRARIFQTVGLAAEPPAR